MDLYEIDWYLASTEVRLEIVYKNNPFLFYLNILWGVSFILITTTAINLVVKINAP